MNRLKKEFKKKGMLLENDYPFMPYYLKGKSCFEPGYILLDGITVKPDAKLIRYLNIGIEINRLNRDGSISSDLVSSISSDLVF